MRYKVSKTVDGVTTDYVKDLSSYELALTISLSLCQSARSYGTVSIDSATMEDLRLMVEYLQACPEEKKYINSLEEMLNV